MFKISWKIAQIIYNTKNLNKKFKIPYIDEFMKKLYTKFKIDSKKLKNE